MEKAIAEDKIIIVAGFQGIGAESKQVTTLGRGGSDLTAVVLSQYLQVEVCEFYKDVDGIYSQDPHIDPSAKHFSSLSWGKLIEIINSGSQVISATAACYAEQHRIAMSVQLSPSVGEKLDKKTTLISEN